MQYLVLALLLAMVGGIDFYLAHHVCRAVRGFVGNCSVWWIFALFVVLTAMMLMTVLRPFDGVLQRVISLIGACWMGLFVYLLLFCVLADVAMLIPWLLGAQTTKLRAIASLCAAVLALSVGVYGTCHARRLYTVTYDVRLDGVGDDMQVALISDVHLGAVGSESRLEKIVERINALSPDLVCIAGDFFDTDFRTIRDPERAIELMRTIESKYGVYACLGNHDAGATFRDMQDFFSQANVTLLEDAYVVIDERLVLAGRLDPSPIGGAGDLHRAETDAVLKDAPTDLPVLVMDHNPASAQSYDDRVDLVLSGHTHKGQIFPGSLATGALYTVDHGYARMQSGTQIIVTSGAGAWGMPMRVGTNCEIVSIKITE